MKLTSVKRIGGILSALALTAAGICLGVQCLHIYQNGAFTRAAAAQAFAPIAWVVYLALALVVATGVVSLIAREGEKKPPMQPMTDMMLERQLARADLTAADADTVAAIRAQRKRRLLITLGRNVVLAACAAAFLVYALDGSHFHSSHINDSMIKAMTVGLPCALVALAASLAAHYLCKGSKEQEITLLKKLPRKNAPSPAPKAGKWGWVRYAALGAAIGLIGYGYITGGTMDVLTKAVNICTECVGLG